MPIKWDSRLSVGNHYIDLQHKLIISQINALEVVLRHPDEKDALKFFIEQLYEFTQDHFHHEEKLQRKFNFPYYEDNKKEHQLIMVELNAMRVVICSFAETANTTVEDTNEVISVATSLVHKWIEHLVKSDMKMKKAMDRIKINGLWFM